MGTQNRGNTRILCFELVYWEQKNSIFSVSHKKIQIPSVTEQEIKSNTNKSTTHTDDFSDVSNWLIIDSFSVLAPRCVPIRPERGTELMQICSTSPPECFSQPKGRGNIHHRAETDGVESERMKPQRAAVNLWGKAEPQIQLQHLSQGLRYSPESCRVSCDVAPIEIYKLIHNR